MVMTGSVSACSAAVGSSQSWRGKPPAGKTRHPSENTATRSIPTQKTGMAPVTCEAAENVVPYHVRDFHAAMNPTGTAISTDSVNEMSVSGSVTLSRRTISSPTESRLVKDWPRSSVASCPR